MLYKLQLAVILALFFAGIQGTSQVVKYSGNWGADGLTLKSQQNNKVLINHSTTEFALQDVDVDGIPMKSIKTPGVFLPNDEGAPDLPGTGRYIAIPQGASVSVNILALEKEVFKNIEVAPAPRIPWDTDSGPLYYEKNSQIYSKDEFYPANTVNISEISQIRGVDVVMLGVTPFQYNPITKELIVYKNIEIEVNIEGGNGQVGDNRLRSRWWDPVVMDAVINPEAIPEMDYSKKGNYSDTPDYEYLIICPNDPTFLAWADSIKVWRTLQGIVTGVVTTTEVGGNTTTAIESYVNNAYNTWAVPPVAVLLLGDYGTSGNTVISPIYNSYCVSDNIFSDVDGNHLPEMVFARMTAQNATHLETMITKFLDYERNPPTNPNFYNNPITACGWQTERWFQLCSEVVGGYWKEVQGKTPVRINEVYSGTPGTSWSTATNTSTVVNYFGPTGLGYIPATPNILGGWTGGNATAINNAINNGAFMLQHRDHGYEQGWGEPSYSSTNINGLTNTDLTWVFSINCLTGKYNYSSEVFTEKFHRYTYNGHNSGALGLTAASEVSYSFVNDAFVWGIFDNLWPDFMPAYGTNPPSRDVLPSFGMAAGKYFLAQSSWPYNTSNKEVTYNLFHHHGDAFTTVYSEVPQYLSVSHSSTLLSGATSFVVTANSGSFIALTVNGEIIGTANGTGSPVSISIPAQSPGDEMIVTVTRQNYYRYSSDVSVIPPSGAYVSYFNHTINDASGNNNGQADFGENILLNMTLKNEGSSAAYNVSASLASTDPYVTITDTYQSFGTIGTGATITQNNAYAINISDDVPDQHTVSFELQISGTSDDTWLSTFSIILNAPELATGLLSIDDASGNNNGKLDPGETVNVIIETSNLGHSNSLTAIGTLACAHPDVNINSGTFNFGIIPTGASENASFSVSIDPGASIGTSVNFIYDVTAGNYTANETYMQVIGQIPVLILDLDPNASSGPIMGNAMDGLSVPFDYLTSFPPDLNIYTSVFVCLGIYSSNHILTATEGQELATYLNNGGQVYMEGGDTWYYDATTVAHGMFNINPMADGSGDMGTVIGASGTFTAGLTFTYSGENNWMDHIDPISPAFSIFSNQSPVYGCAVAYDAGAYKTIGASYEFGGLSDGASPSTKENLMNEYLTFFGITGTPLLPADISVNPLSFEVSLEPDATQIETLSISNTGEVGLNFNIAVSGSDALQGKLPQLLTQQQKQDLRYKTDYSNAYNELSPGVPNPENWVLPALQNPGQDESKGIETFGSWTGGSYSGSVRDRGNIFHVTTTTTLQEIQFYLDITSSTQLYFFVYEGSAVSGTFSKINEVYIASSGTGTGWYSSGAMNVTLDAGNYYYIGTSWNGTATYGRGTEAVPLTTSFGTLETGVPATTAGYPPAATCTNAYTTTSPYYQTLVTSSTPVYNWLVPSVTSGNVPGLSSTNIDILFDATGLTTGTYIKDLEITSNDPDQPLIIVPCTLHVNDIVSTMLNATAFLEGPFVSTEMVPFLNYFGFIPLAQPYNTSPWNYNGTEVVTAIPSLDVVDWVLIELRETPGDVTTATPSTMIARQAGFILTDGSIVSSDGTSQLSFGVTITQNLFVVVYHRNHLGIISADPVTLNGGMFSIDFTTSESKVFGAVNGQKEIEPGIWGMCAGDASANGEIDNIDKDDYWHAQYNGFGYLPGDFDMNGQVDNTDRNVKWKENAGRCSFIVK
ncbi:MAG: hypothetical protein K9G76_08490 [Bacteroidales bacterium]|nr:hypothetical protein [Bacteroidales bacterium]MCF8403476.1 hypothetical protein [Bacteroidales bacterium]